MYGAILGDMIGAPYEFDRGDKTKEFPMFINESHYTDDTVMTVAVAEALMKTLGKDDVSVRYAVEKSMRKWGRKYPHAGYGFRFYHWLREREPEPYGSYGNGSAMRVSSAGWLYDTLEETRHAAVLTAEMTHNHPEGIKGAEATASAIFMARTGSSKDEIRDYIVREFGYDLSRTCDEIRPDYHHVESCQETVPEAITAFLEGTDFEDVIRTAVSLGGDCDTLTCIAGSIAEAFYGIPEDMIAECRKCLPEDILAVLDEFTLKKHAAKRRFDDPFLQGNEMIEKAISTFHAETTKENLCAVMDSIRTRMHQDGHWMIPVIRDEKGNGFTFCTLRPKDGTDWLVAFTSQKEYEKSESSQIISNFIDMTLKGCLNLNAAGIIINPWGQSFKLSKELIDMIIKADGDVEYHVPDDAITPELLEGGAFLKRATAICNRNRTQLNLIRLIKILRDSWVWIPCKVIMSDADDEAFKKLLTEAEQGDGLESIVGKEFTCHDGVRMVPDILQNGDQFFFPVFTSAEEMGEYGKQFSQIEKHFLEAINMARNNEKDVAGIVINAFSEPFIVPRELFEIIMDLPSSFTTNTTDAESSEKE